MTFREVCTKSPALLLSDFARDLAEVTERASGPEQDQLIVLQHHVAAARARLKAVLTPSPTPGFSGEPAGTYDGGWSNSGGSLKS